MQMLCADFWDSTNHKVLQFEVLLLEAWGGCEGLLWGTLKRLNCATSKACLKVDGKFGSPYQETFTSNIALIQSKY